MNHIKIIYTQSPCFGWHVKPLFPAAFAVVSTYQSTLGLSGGFGPFYLSVIHKEGLLLSSGEINRLMTHYPRRASRDISDIRSRHSDFSNMT
jgi:hypothetical protein